MAVLTLEQKLDPRFLLTNHGVKNNQQAKLCQTGIHTLPKFEAFVTIARELANLLKSEFGLDSGPLRIKDRAVQLPGRQLRQGFRQMLKPLAKPIPTSDDRAIRQTFALRGGIACTCVNHASRTWFTFSDCKYLSHTWGRE